MAKDAKNLILDTTWELVLKKGFKATKVQDICLNAGISKMTFYYYFKNKHEVIDLVLKSFFKLAVENSENIMKKDVPFRDKIMELIHWKSDFVKQMSPEFLQELYTGNGDYVEYMKDVMQKTQKLMNDFYTEGKVKGEINRTIDVPVMMFWVNLVSDMIIEGKFSDLFDDPNEMNRQIRDLILYGILGSNHEEDYHDLTMF